VRGSEGRGSLVLDVFPHLGRRPARVHGKRHVRNRREDEVSVRLDQAGRLPNSHQTLVRLIDSDKDPCEHFSTSATLGDDSALHRWSLPRGVPASGTALNEIAENPKRGSGRPRMRSHAPSTRLWPTSERKGKEWVSKLRRRARPPEVQDPNGRPGRSAEPTNGCGSCSRGRTTFARLRRGGAYSSGAGSRCARRPHETSVELRRSRQPWCPVRLSRAPWPS
jgi:hypothetical protein